MALLPERERLEAIAKLTDREIEHLLYDWRFWARPKQLPPEGDWRTWLLLSGRGFGKTRAGAEFIIDRVRQGYHRIALVGQTKADVRDTMIEVGDSAILNISPPWFVPDYQPSKRRLVWPNGAIAVAFSGDEPGQLRGPQHDTAWVDELAKFKYPQETWDNLMMGLRIGEQPQAVVTTTPKPIKAIKELIADQSTVTVRGSTYENVANLAPAFLEYVLQKYEGTTLGRQELHAEMLDDDPNALWQRAMIAKHRVTRPPLLDRIVVAVDPHTSKGVGECGIVVAGVATLSKVTRGYVLDDMTIGGRPEQWATQVLAAYHKHRADRIVAEKNQGGDMVEHTIRSVEGGENVPITLVWASRGKRARAEPVSALYEQGRVHHVGTMGELEDELCTWVPGETAESPNRLDALVWALTELMIGTGVPAGAIVEVPKSVYRTERKRGRLWA